MAKSEDTGIHSEFERKRIERLMRRGLALIDSRSYPEVLEVARELRRARYSGAYELAALALAATGKLDKAIVALERGVEGSPGAWGLWELLGNLRSDADRFEGAADAYERALSCVNVDVDSIRLNQAILAQRRGNFSQALDLVELCSPREQRLQRTSLKASVLLNLGRPKDALAQCSAVVCPDTPTKADRASLARVSETHARARLAVGDPVDRVQTQVLAAIRTYPESAGLLYFLRELRNQRSSNAFIFHVCLSYEVDFTRRDDDTIGFTRCGRVVADDSAEAISLVRDLEASTLPFQSDPEVERVRKSETDLKGVFVLSPQAYFSRA